MVKKVLIVDDEADIIDILICYFEAKGWTVESAANGKIALEKVSSFNPDVVLTDINMPEMNGMELLEALNKMESEVPVIFLTAFRDVNSMQKAWGLCAFDFLDKPFNEAVMLQVAENALEYGRDYTRAARKRYLSLKKT